MEGYREISLITVSNEIRQAKIYDLEDCILVSAGKEKILDTDTQMLPFKQNHKIA